VTNKRKKHSAGFKAKVALEAVKERKTASELGTQYELHSTQIAHWKKQLKEGAPSIFEQPGKVSKSENKEAELYEEIGRLKMQLEWLKKKAALFDE